MSEESASGGAGCLIWICVIVLLLKCFGPGLNPERFEARIGDLEQEVRMLKIKQK